MLAAITRKFRHPPPATLLLHAMTTSSARQPNADAALVERRGDGPWAARRPLALAQPPIPHAANRSLGLPPYCARTSTGRRVLRHRVADREHVRQLRRKPHGIDAGVLRSDSFHLQVHCHRSLCVDPVEYLLAFCHLNDKCVIMAGRLLRAEPFASTIRDRTTSTCYRHLLSRRPFRAGSNERGQR
jgi:hypothetical protein